MSSSQLTFIFFRGVAQPPARKNVEIFAHVDVLLHRGKATTWMARVMWRMASSCAAAWRLVDGLVDGPLKDGQLVKQPMGAPITMIF